MEDYSPKGDSEKQSGLNRRRRLRGSFLNSWLRRRQKPELAGSINSEEEDEEYDSSGSKKESKKPSFIVKFRSFLPNLFKSLIKIDRVPVTETSVGGVFQTESAGQERELSDYEKQRQYVEARAEQLTSDAEDSEENLGLLPVSDEAIKRYQQLAEQTVNQDMAEPEPGTLEYEDLESEEERRRLYENDISTTNNGNVGGAERQPNSSTGAMSAGEVLRQKRELGRQKDKQYRLKRQVKKIKHEAKSLKKEQGEFKKRQNEFSEELSRQDRVDKKIINQQLTNIEQSEDKFQTNTEFEKPRNQVLEPAPFEIPSLKPNRDIRPELSPERLKVVLGPAAEVSPEVVLHKVEAAAESGLPIEKMYEKRHEIKGEDSTTYDQPLNEAKAHTHFASGLPNIRPRHSYTVPPPTLPPPLLTKINLNSIKNQLNEGMYKQAIKSGFMAGIIACILLALLALIH